MADDCEDTGHHAPHLRNWRPTRTRLEESRATRRDALEERLQGHRHHTRANACDASFTALTSSLYAGARVCCYSALRFVDAVVALSGRAVGGREHTDLQPMGNRCGRQDKYLSIGALGSTASNTR